MNKFDPLQIRPQIYIGGMHLDRRYGANWPHYLTPKSVWDLDMNEFHLDISALCQKLCTTCNTDHAFPSQGDVDAGFNCDDDTEELTSEWREYIIYRRSLPRVPDEYEDKDYVFVGPPVEEESTTRYYIGLACNLEREPSNWFEGSWSMNDPLMAYFIKLDPPSGFNISAVADLVSKREYRAVEVRRRSSSAITHIELVSSGHVMHEGDKFTRDELCQIIDLAEESQGEVHGYIVKCSTVDVGCQSFDLQMLKDLLCELDAFMKEVEEKKFYHGATINCPNSGHSGYKVVYNSEDRKFYLLHRDTYVLYTPSTTTKSRHDALKFADFNLDNGEWEVV